MQAGVSQSFSRHSQEPPTHRPQSEVSTQPLHQQIPPAHAVPFGAPSDMHPNPAMHRSAATHGAPEGGHNPSMGMLRQVPPASHTSSVQSISSSH